MIGTVTTVVLLCSVLLAAAAGAPAPAPAPAPAAAASTTATIATDVELWQALADSGVQEIQLAQDVILSPQAFDATKRIVLSRNVTIASQSRQPQSLCLSFLGPKLQLEPGVWLVLRNIVTQNVSLSPSFALDIVASSKGATVWLDNCTRLMPTGMQTTGEVAATLAKSYTRPTGIPGSVQRISNGGQVCVAGHGCFTDNLYVEDFAATLPASYPYAPVEYGLYDVWYTQVPIVIEYPIPAQWAISGRQLAVYQANLQLLQGNTSGLASGRIPDATLVASHQQLGVAAGAAAAAGRALV
jgi:hypothetical protein